ncbi:MAG: Biotin carboxyl carrier protein of acetyl-CoA carboxylase [Alphaproteobacteria bacterium MarineAlpha6_Bin1]|jgi:acetyl-CoA carboxylase biotin carboxyl carrier protein|nr:MAG: Biotin carboxyl carrier protein of acetyl-CoA carboxylase [Alphaproteobacteria bacterium MarineAlpha6_Bin1]
MTIIDKKDIENIENLHKILKSKNLGSIKIKKGNYEIEVSLKKQSTVKSSDSTLDKQQTKLLQTSQIKEKEIKQENIVSSPIVGVVYLSPEPTKPPFIKESQHVKQGDILMLIEAMKTFNEIKAPKSGVIKKIVVLDSQPVEFGELLVIFE